MAANPTSARPASPSLRPRFVLVNDRVPRADTSCAECSAKIERGYVREPHTRLVYCDARCFTRRGKLRMSGILNLARRVS